MKNNNLAQILNAFDYMRIIYPLTIRLSPINSSIIYPLTYEKYFHVPTQEGPPPQKVFGPLFLSGLIMEISGGKGSNLSELGFRQLCSEFQSPLAKQSVSLQNILIGHAALAYQCLRVCGKWQGILGLNRIGLGWLLRGYLRGLEGHHRIYRGLCVLHKTLIANARYEYWLLNATRSGRDHQFHCPCGTPKWVKTRLAASLRQGLMVILSAKSIHA